MRTLAAPPDYQLLAARIASLTPQNRARWGRMNVYQMMRHLDVALLVPLGEKQVNEKSRLFWRTLVKWGALWCPTPWPRNVPTPLEMDTCHLGIVDGDFEAARQQVLAQLARLHTATVEGIRHPIFGDLTHKEWMRWGWLHTDHHLRQFGA